MRVIAAPWSEAVVKIPCRCLTYNHAPHTLSGATHTHQILPGCILHRRFLAPDVCAWLEAEVAAAKAAADLDHAWHHGYGWQQILRGRLEAFGPPRTGGRHVRDHHSQSEGAHQ